IAAAALTLAPSCAGPAPPPAAGGLQATGVLARGALSYAVASAGADRLVSIELTTAFELVVRDLARGDAPVIARVPLGGAAYDVLALAPARRGDRAWVASADGRVREPALPSGEVLRTWRLGAPATAVATSRDGAYIA